MTNVNLVTNKGTLVAGATLSAKDKGSFGNRVDCTKEHVINNAKSMAKSTVAATIGAGAAYGVYKYIPNSHFKSANAWANGWINKAANYTKSAGGKLANFTTKMLNKLAQTSGRTKAIALIGVTTLLVVNKITQSQAFKAGQIDQKYTDRAKAQEIAK